MMYLGSQFLVANIAPYINSYFEDCTTAESQTLLPIGTTVGMFSNFFGSLFFKRRLIHPKLFLLLFGSIGISGFYFSSYCVSWTSFKYLFSISLGLTGGSTYMAAVSIAWQYFPGKEGTISGVIIGGFGIGSFLFTYLSTILVNPKEVDSDMEALKPFPREVAENLPHALRMLGICFYVILALSVILI